MHPNAALCALHGLTPLLYVSGREYRLVRELAPQALAIYHRYDRRTRGHKWQGTTGLAISLLSYKVVDFDAVPDEAWDCFRPELLEALLEGRSTM